MSDGERIALVRQYFDHLLAGNLDALGAMLDDEIVWHQPGQSSVSGTYRGKAALFAHLGRLMTLSRGTFAIDSVDDIMGNGDLVAARIHFGAKHDERHMAMNGVDVIRVDRGKLQEVWLYSSDQSAEDAFWDATAAEG